MWQKSVWTKQFSAQGRLRNNSMRLTSTRFWSQPCMKIGVNIYRPSKIWWRIRQVDYSTMLVTAVLTVSQSNHVMLAEVQCETESNPWRPDSGIDFLDRQRMRMIEDKILDLIVIFESLQDTLSQLQRHCRRQCRGPRLCENCKCTTTIEELKDQMRVTRINLKRVEVVYKRAQSTTQLVCYFPIVNLPRLTVL